MFSFFFTRKPCQVASPSPTIPSALPAALPQPPRRTRIAHPPPPQAHPDCLECGLPWGIPCIVLAPPPTDSMPIACSDMDVAKLEVWPYDNRPGSMEEEATDPHRYTLPPVPSTVLPVAGHSSVRPQRPSRSSSAPSLDLDLSVVDVFASTAESQIAAPPRPVRQVPILVSRLSMPAAETIKSVPRKPCSRPQRTPLSDTTNTSSLAMRRPTRLVRVRAKVDMAHLPAGNRI